MTTKPMAQTLNDLFDYLGDDRWDLGEMLIDVCEGAEILNPHTKKLVGELIAAMPEPDNFSAEDLATEIRKVGTPFAVSVADDMNSAI